jgi:hypothetical protein
MEKRKFQLAIIGIMVMFGIGACLANLGTAVATEAQLVKIQPISDPLKEGSLSGLAIDPETLNIKKNTIVLWMNGVPQEEVQVIFEDGKACKDVTANPVRFEMPGNSTCYVTTFIPFGDTSSLQFPQAGTFKYSIKNLKGNFKASGEIIVE